MITRPSLSEILGYRKHVDAAVDTLLSSHVTRNVAELVELGTHIGTVDAVADGRIGLARRDSGEGAHKNHNHLIGSAWLPPSRIRGPACWRIRPFAVTFEEEQSGKPI